MESNEINKKHFSVSKKNKDYRLGTYVYYVDIVLAGSFFRTDPRYSIISERYSTRFLD